jgi:hypothetical protein
MYDAVPSGFSYGFDDRGSLHVKIPDQFLSVRIFTAIVEQEYEGVAEIAFAKS